VRELCRAAVKPGVNACKGGHTPGALPSMTVLASGAVLPLSGRRLDGRCKHILFY